MPLGVAGAALLLIEVLPGDGAVPLRMTLRGVGARIRPIQVGIHAVLLVMKLLMIPQTEAP